MSLFKKKDSAIDEATAWQATLNSDLVTVQQQYDFEQWLSHSAENQHAWVEISLFWDELDSINTNDISLDFNTITHNSPFTLSTLKTKWRSKTILAIAASLLLMVTFFPQLPTLFADHYTISGGLKQMTLSDGSKLIMNSNTALSIDYNDKNRKITLHHGEAYFDVAKDKQRPFYVQTAYGNVRALGTEFDIKSRGDTVAVTVFEHAVKISLNNGGIMESLPEGKQLSFNNQKILSSHTVNLSRTQSWRQQQIIFLDKPLAEVLVELSYYRSGVIMITDKTINALTVTGIFDTQDTNIALKTIEQSLPVNITKITEKLVLVSAK